MKPIDPAELLRALADVDEQVPDTLPADDVLRQYREGALSQGDAAAVEAVLAQSPVARERLAALANVALPAPPPAVRERVLAVHAASSNAGSPAPRRTSSRRARRGSRRVWWGAAAAAAAVVLALGYGLRPVEPLPESLAYMVTARGIETSRGVDPNASDTTTAAVIEATGDTLVLLSLAAVDVGAPGLDYALYRPTGGSPPTNLERVPSLPELRSEAGAGGVIFEVPAAVLLGEEPGDYVVYMVAARRGDLPERLRLSPQIDPLDVLTDDGRRRAHAVRVVLRETAPLVVP